MVVPPATIKFGFLLFTDTPIWTVVAITVILIVAETTIYDMSVLAVGQSLMTPLNW